MPSKKMDKLRPATELLPTVKDTFRAKSTPPAPASVTRAFRAGDEERLYAYELDHVVRFFSLPPEQYASMFTFRTDVGIDVNARRLGARADEFIAELQGMGYVVQRKAGATLRVSLPLK